MTTQHQLSAPRIGLTFAGSILGAGYLSGQELMQFFGAFGQKGLLGLFLAMALLAVLTGMAMLLAKRTGLVELDRIIIPWEKPVLRRGVALLEIVFLLATVVIMYAGVGALLEQLLGLPVWVGSLLMCVLATGTAMYGLDGTIRFFSLLVPPTVVITVLFGILAIITMGVPVIPEPEADNPLLGSFLPSAISFTSYNFFGIIGLLAPVGTLSRSNKTPFRGAVVGAALLTVIAVSILGPCLPARRRERPASPCSWWRQSSTPFCSILTGWCFLAECSALPSMAWSQSPRCWRPRSLPLPGTKGAFWRGWR